MEEVTLYFTAQKRIKLRELARELEFQLNLPIKLERVKKKEVGKIGGVNILGNYPCCAPFLRKCPFGGKFGCGYGLASTQRSAPSTQHEEEKPATLKHRMGDTEAQKVEKREKKKRRRVVRRVVLKA